MKPVIAATVLYKDILGGGDVSFITKVNADGTVDLMQLSFAGHLIPRQKVVYGFGFGQWHGPADVQPVPAAPAPKLPAATPPTPPPVPPPAG